MIVFLSNWVKNLSLALIIVSILEMLLPNNKTKKYVKMIMGLYILFSIISPFIENSNLFNVNNLDWDSHLKSTETSSIVENIDQTSMDTRLNQIYKEQLEEDIVTKIEEKGYEVETCKVDAHVSNDGSGIEKIILKIDKKNNTNENEQGNGELENKIVAEVKKIKISKNKNETNEENSNITKTDLKIISNFLIEEYGVSEKCLKIN